MKGLLPKRRIWIIIALGLAVWFYFCLPKRLFRVPYSTVLLAEDGTLLAARTAADGQWRFPPCDSVPYKFKISLVTFEDRYFDYHPGVNPVSLISAARQNLQSGRTVRGGSTISMQVIRLSRGNKVRSLWEKIIEIIQATRLELRYNKSEILKLYASHAPFGGNTVGLDAAAWRYFGRSATNLSWAEAATLAILPNSPSLIHPGRNREKLLQKRNRLLQKLQAEGFIDQNSYQLAISEPIPQAPKAVPGLAKHLLHTAEKAGKSGSSIHTSIRPQLQERIASGMQRYADTWHSNSIFNAAVLVLNCKTGKVLAYHGNMPDVPPGQGGDVDMIMASRSTGSTLKPLLFASMLHEGLILPSSLQADIPTQIAGYVPKNYDLGFDGAVPARNAIYRSLNVPAVRMLQSYGVGKFTNQLRRLGLSTLNRPASHYGLSLILGGAEARLWELCGIYAQLAYQLNNYAAESQIQHSGIPAFRLGWEKDTDITRGSERPKVNLSAAAIYEMFEAMSDVSRPDEQAGWFEFISAGKIAWKTGTSFGARDAWAIGVSPDYVVGVWVGNASGRGRPMLTGIGAAAPLMFDVFSLLPRSGWFARPYDDMIQEVLCRKSGFRSGSICTLKDTVWIPKAGAKTPPCPFHREVFLNETMTLQVNADCYPLGKIKKVPWFVLPPAWEHFYRNNHLDYLPLPRQAPNCITANEAAMQFLYPTAESDLFLPRTQTGQYSKFVFEIAHRRPFARIYWHLDGTYLGETRNFHQIAVQPSPGQHIITAVDEDGEQIQRRFRVISRS